MYYTNSDPNKFILPGRLRIFIIGLNGNRKFAERIDHCLSGTKGIGKVTANQYTGNVLVYFKEEYIDISSIEKRIDELRHEIDSEGVEIFKHTRGVNNRYQVYEQLEKNIKRVYGKLVPAALAVSLISCIVSGNFLLPLSVLVMVHPYMIYRSVKVALRSAAANAYKNGIIINRPSKLETAGKVDTIVFHNISLLTAGNCKVSNIIPTGRNSENRILMLAASCACTREDPIAKALIDEAANRNLEIKQVSNFKVCMDRGITCKIDGKEVLVGNKKQLAERNLFTESHLLNERKLKHLGQYPIFVTYNHKIIGIIGFHYVINKNSIPAIEAMRETGIDTIKIMTEENEEIVKNIALEAGIESCEVNLQPESKMKKIAELKSEGKTIALIQDGFHDCLPVQTEMINITFSNTNRSLIHKCSDFVIINGDLRSIPRIIDLGKYTEEVILQNGIISLGLDAIGTLLLLTNYITPYTALLYKFVNGFIVLLNARKPIKYK